MNHERFMNQALQAARRALGSTAPNPAVGCVVVNHGRVLAVAATAPGGRPHAEPQALAVAGTAAEGADIYVTLEPCAHVGHTPPCVEALIKAAPRRVIVAVRDVDPRVAGRGIERLHAAGIEVIEGVGRTQAEALYAGFFGRLTRRRPQVTLKIALSLDGRIAAGAGLRTPLTGDESFRYVQYLRAEHEGIAVGSGTVLSDDPHLDCRLPGLIDRSPARLVFDRRARMPTTAHLWRTARVHAVHWLTDAPSAERRLEAESAGVIVHDGVRDLHEGLARVPLNTVLVEGGGTLAAALLRVRLIDRLIVLSAPIVLGNAGVPAFDAPETAGFRPIEMFACGRDRVGIYLPQEAACA